VKAITKLSILFGGIAFILVITCVVVLYLFKQDTERLHAEVTLLIERNAPLSEFEKLLGIRAEKVMESKGGDDEGVIFLLKYEGLPPFEVWITRNPKTGEMRQAGFR
jgi:hypothetical protein